MIIMVRIGERILAFTTQGVTSGMVGISIRDPVVGQKVLIVPTGTGGTIAIRPFNTYTGDEGVAMPLPCGCTVYLPGEPPDYLNMESAISCQQGVPTTDGWECNSTCNVHPVFNPCARGANGGWVNELNAMFCQNDVPPRNYEYKYWQANRTLHPEVREEWWSCGSYCRLYQGCTADKGNTKVHIPTGCRAPSQRTYSWKVIQPAYYSYACGGCPNFNGGRGIAPCRTSTPPFSPGQKPACQYPANLQFLGWYIPGGSGSVSKTCVLNKVSEAVQTNPTGEIRCHFS